MCAVYQLTLATADRVVDRSEYEAIVGRRQGGSGASALPARYKARARSPSPLREQQGAGAEREEAEEQRAELELRSQQDARSTFGRHGAFD